jgi:hypothetical protein
MKSLIKVKRHPHNCLASQAIVMKDMKQASLKVVIVDTQLVLSDMSFFCYSVLSQARLPLQKLIIDDVEFGD